MSLAIKAYDRIANLSKRADFGAGTGSVGRTGRPVLGTDALISASTALAATAALGEMEPRLAETLRHDACGAHEVWEKRMVGGEDGVSFVAAGRDDGGSFIFFS